MEEKRSGSSLARELPGSYSPYSRPWLSRAVWAVAMRLSDSERKTLNHHRNKAFSRNHFSHIDEVQLGEGNFIHTWDTEIGRKDLPHNSTDVLAEYQQVGAVCLWHRRQGSTDPPRQLLRHSVA